MFLLFLRLPEKGPRSKWTIYKHESDKNKKCLSSCLSSVACLQPTPAYVEALLKIPYFILGYPNIARFLIFETLCLCRTKTLTYVWQKYDKNERHLRLVAHIQIFWYIDMPDGTTNYGTPFDFIEFFGYFHT